MQQHVLHNAGGANGPQPAFAATLRQPGRQDISRLTHAVSQTRTAPRPTGEGGREQLYRFRLLKPSTARAK